jgi:peptidoglycan/LPS O-acetylase OafA/YrhL
MATRHFRTLDALRGLSALAVVFYHLPVGGLAPRGYLAVDLFFLMSGFVVAHAYEERLRSGWGVGRFLLARLKRLWPLYALGIGLGVLCYQLAKEFAPQHGIVVPDMPLATIVVLNVMFLPWTAVTRWPMFPLNSPAWSLSVEMIGNLVYGIVARTVSDTTLKVLTALGALGLGMIVYRAHSLDVGVDASNALGGYVRFAFSFPLGVLFYRHHRASRLPRLHVAWPFVLAAAACVFAGLLPLEGVGDLIAVLVIFPLLLLASLSREPAPRTAAAFAFVGALSYPLYIVHHPLLDLLRALHPAAIVWWLAVPAIIAVAAALVWVFDAPLQRLMAAIPGQIRAHALK